MIDNVLSPVFSGVLSDAFGGSAGPAPITFDLKAFTGTVADQTFANAQELDTAAEGVESGSLTVVDTATGSTEALNDALRITGDGGFQDNGVYTTAAVTKSFGKGAILTYSSGSDTHDETIGFNGSGGVVYPGFAPFYGAYIVNKSLQAFVGSKQISNIVTLNARPTGLQLLIIIGGFDSGDPYNTGKTAADYTDGMIILAKGDKFTDWTLMWSEMDTISATPYYQINERRPTTLDSTNILIPTDAFDVDVLFQPDFLDRFTGTNGDSLTNNHTPDVVGGAAGTGNPYSSAGNTWTIQSNAAVNSAYAAAANTEFFGLDTSKSSGFFDVLLTMSELESGRILCADSITSPSNYLLSYYDFVNGRVKLDKVVAGTPTSLISVVAAYSAGACLRTIVREEGSDLKVRVYYNDTAIGTEQTISDVGIVGNTIHGGYSTSTTNSLDLMTNRNDVDSAWDTEIASATGSIY